MLHNIKNISLTALAALLICSCSGFLDEKTNGQVSDNSLLTQNGLESALTGSYTGLHSPWSMGFGNGTTTQLTFGGDDIAAPASDANGYQLDTYSVTNSNGSMGGSWNGCYKAIQGSNQVIANYENCEGDASVIKVIAGEAYFIRAFSYFWLVRLHGRVPIVTSSVYDSEEANMEPSEISEIYALIEDDLGKAIEMLGDSKRGGEAGRPNKGSAIALLAEVYLQEAGWPLKKDGYYAKAAEEAKLLLDNRAKYGYDFADSYATLYKNRDDEECVTCEDIFPITGNLSSNNIILYGDWCMPGEIGGWDCVMAEIAFFKNFPEGVRKDATFATEFVSQDGTKTWTWEQLGKKRPYYKKLMIAGPNMYNYYSSIPIHLLRFTQTALTYAEAKARSGGPDALAYECLNTIRRRAELPEYSGLSASEFADACVQERAWELCGESVRWFDMTRLDMVASVIAQREADQSKWCKDESTDPRDHKVTKTITEADYFLPIPASEVLLNPNLGK